MRKLALWVVGLALAVFIARQFLHPERDASWVARPTAPEPEAQSTQRLRETAAMHADLRDVVTTESAVRAEPARSCPDLERLLAELAQAITTDRLRVQVAWNPACEAIAQELDGHCRSALVAIAGEPERATHLRLAAWSLVAAHPAQVSGDELDEQGRALLWVCADPGRPAPLEESAAGPTGAQRHEIARVAGQCLAVLGHAGDRARLAGWLLQAQLGQLARLALSQARTGDALGGVLSSLESEQGSVTQSALLLGDWLDRGVVELSPGERARAAEAAERAWDLQDGSSKAPVHFLLLQLDPDRCATAWTRRLDAGLREQADITHAVRALMMRAQDGDLERVQALLHSPRERERLAAAGQVLLREQVWTRPGATVVDAERTLGELARSSPSATTRKQALRSLVARPSTQRALALSALAADEDPGVRIASARLLAEAFADQPEVLGALRAAAAGDSDQDVRRAAGRFLERSAPGSHSPQGSGSPSGN